MWMSGIPDHYASRLEVLLSMYLTPIKQSIGMVKIRPDMDITCIIRSTGTLVYDVWFCIYNCDIHYFVF